jgi:DNA polymerase, archaea type
LKAVERETGILTEVDSYDWITFLPMSDGTGAYNRYFGRLNTGKMKIRGVIDRKGDTPDYVNKMQQEVFEVLAEAKSLEELKRIEPKARQVYRKYMDELEGADVKGLAIHRIVSRLNYSRRRAEASAVQAHMKQGIPLAPGMEIGYVIRDARKWEVDPERTASKFDAMYYRVPLEKAWGEMAFVLTQMMASPINPHNYRNCSICRRRIDLGYHHFCQ